MNKLFKAFKNEFYKVFSKKSIIIISVLMVICEVVIAFAFIQPDTRYQPQKPTPSFSLALDSRREDADAAKQNIKDKGYSMDKWNEYDEEQKRKFISDISSIELYEQIANMFTEEPEVYDFIADSKFERALIAKDKAICEKYVKPYSIEEYWLNENTNFISSKKIPKDLSFDESIEWADKQIKLLDEIVTNKDYVKYIEDKKLELKMNPNSNEWGMVLYYDIECEIYDMYVACYNKTGIDELNLSMKARHIAMEYRSYKQRINEGKNGNRLYSEDEIKEFENYVAEIKYKLESGYCFISENAAFTANNIEYLPVAVSVGMFFIILLLIMIGGSTISDEYSRGTIKSLLVSPVKRKKIFWAKLLMVLTLGIFMLLLLALTIIVLLYIIYGAENILPYILATNGVVHKFSFAVYTLLYICASFISVLFYVSLAVMLSAVTKNNAVSIGVSVGVYYIVPTVLLMLKYVMPSYALKYIPMICVEAIRNLLFPQSLGGYFGELAEVLITRNTGYIDIGLGYAVCYVGMLIVAMIWTARDSFCKRDVK